MAIYKYITDEDITGKIKSDLLDNIVNNESHRVPDAEAEAVSQVKSKLNDRYDLSKIFIKIDNWDAANPFLQDEYAYRSGKIYKAIQDNTGQDPDQDNGTYWTEEDPRISIIRMVIVDIMLYHLHSSINPRKIPELRQNRYDEAMMWLTDVRDMKENPEELPLKTEGTDEVLIDYKHDKREHLY